MDIKSQKIIEDLFNVFMDDYRLLPKSLSFEINNNTSDKDKATQICTYISDMTDAMAVEEHQKLFNISYRF
jgi:dGTP triphosphohydrolase